MSADNSGSRFPTPMSGTGNRLYVDVAALLDEGLPEPPRPVLLHRTDEVAVFYAGRVNVVFGDPESGKTLLVTAAVVEALRAGRRVLWLDLDHNGAVSTVERLLAFGAPEDRLRDLDRFRYADPEDRDDLDAIIRDVEQTPWGPAVAVVDSIGEMLPLLGAGSNSPDEFTLANRRVLTRLARTGAAVLAVDHLAKNPESRQAGPTGTAAKRRAVDGIALRVVLDATFIPGRGGSCHLFVNKDRPGGLRARCPQETGRTEQYAGSFTLQVDDLGLVRWHVKAPSDIGVLPTSVTPADLDALDSLTPPPTSVEDVRKRLHWRKQRAVDALRVWRQQESVPLEPVPGTNQGQG